MTDASPRSLLLGDVAPENYLGRHWKQEDDRAAMADLERWASVGLGAAMGVGFGRHGDAVGAAGALLGAALVLRGLTGYCPVRHAVFQRNPAKTVAKDQGWSQAALVHAGVTINRPRQELYEAWRDFSNLAKWMENITSIEVRDAKTSHWVVKAPLGKTVEWDAVVTEDIPGERIAWETAPGAQIRSMGWVQFKDATGGRGTEVSARFAYRPPAGPVGRIAARLSQREPAVQAKRDLRRFKMFMETGEIAVSHVPGHPATAQDLRL